MFGWAVLIFLLQNFFEQTMEQCSKCHQFFWRIPNAAFVLTICIKFLTNAEISKHGNLKFIVKVLQITSSSLLPI